jgi:D-arabinose 1-dehydrogenase-like Zn-dependent alcohol dehydrogenase
VSDFDVYCKEGPRLSLLGRKGTLLEAVKSIKLNGVVQVIGASKDEAPATSLFDLAVALVFSRGKVNNLPHLGVSYAYCMHCQINGITPGGKDVAQRLDSFISKHKLKPAFDSKVFRWEEAREAYDYFQSGAHFGKVVIRID